MAQLHQMQITFAPEEDRLLFRINTVSRQRAEFRFWFTRRYVRLLWQALINMLKMQHEKEPEPFKGEAAKSAALEVEHQEVVAKADFKTQYEESQVFPLGETPILVSRVALKQGPDGQQVLCLHPQIGQGLEFALNKQILHSFCKLLVDSAEKAEWNLDLDFGQAEDLISKRGLN